MLMDLLELVLAFVLIIFPICGIWFLWRFVMWIIHYTPEDRRATVDLFRKMGVNLKE